MYSDISYIQVLHITLYKITVIHENTRNSSCCCYHELPFQRPRDPFHTIEGVSKKQRSAEGKRKTHQATTNPNDDQVDDSKGHFLPVRTVSAPIEEQPEDTT
jgi:hypothetical protein